MVGELINPMKIQYITEDMDEKLIIPKEEKLNIVKSENPRFEKIRRKRSQVKMACGNIYIYI